MPIPPTISQEAPTIDIPIQAPADLGAEESNRGLLMALAVIGVWASSLVFLCLVDISKFQTWQLLPAMAWQMFLYTGLFITAHDAMHGAVYPKNHKVNDWIGAFAVGAYALFSYRKLREKHWEHHQSPASELDPDFHNLKHKNFFAWYFHFMTQHWSWLRILGLMIIFNILSAKFHVSERNMNLFWVIPSLLSSVQLFYFGTFLPHREPAEGYSDPHRAVTIPRSAFWSFITCYNFGYHEEHHEYPHVPWWQLPQVYQWRNQHLDAKA